VNSNPKLFIGSASESLDIARALEDELQNVASTEVWEDAFRPGYYTLEELTRKASEVDFAAFILGQEDKTDSRGDMTLSPRDNVVYEAGLFAGRLGVPRVFLLVDSRGTKIPTDWKGLGYVMYDGGAGSTKDAVHPAAVRIRKEISDWAINNASSVDERILGHWWQYVVNRMDGAVLSMLNIASSPSSSGWQIRGTAWTGDGKSVAEYWSRAVALDGRDSKLFYYWEGKDPFGESIPQYFGVGEIQFDGPGSGLISNGDGWYSESPLVKLDATLRKSTKYIRASETDFQVTKGNDRAALDKLIAAQLEQRKGYMLL